MKRPIHNERLQIRLPSFRFVEIHWHDAIGVAGGWVKDDELPTPIPHISRGWLVRDEPDHVVIAASFGHDDKGELGYGEVLCIPRGMIAYLDDYPEKT
jgi:hypothetical protein